MQENVFGMNISQVGNLSLLWEKKHINKLRDKTVELLEVKST
jgi:hypothetical protein